MDDSRVVLTADWMVVHLAVSKAAKWVVWWAAYLAAYSVVLSELMTLVVQ